MSMGVCEYGCLCVWVSVYMCKEDLKVTRQWQSGGEGARKTDRPRNQTQHSAHFWYAVCSIT